MRERRTGLGVRWVGKIQGDQTLILLQVLRIMCCAVGLLGGAAYHADQGQGVILNLGHKVNPVHETLGK